ncbi:MAG TPA: hypothetical protein ENK55_01550 [Actinobacteria bacterium]|nr:hypothetical protein [Actinomycetota bacterium]
MNGNGDPKPGRWILPLVVLGLIGFTYIFVNALPPAEVAAPTTSTVPETTTTPPPSTTTTTLPDDVVAFLAEVERFGADARELQTALHAVNDSWENREETGTTFKEALAGFEEVLADARSFAAEVEATLPPEVGPYRELWPRVTQAAEGVVTAVEEVIEGLRAPDDGTRRRQAVVDFDAAVQGLGDALDAVRAAVPGSGDS